MGCGASKSVDVTRPVNETEAERQEGRVDAGPRAAEEHGLAYKV